MGARELGVLWPVRNESLDNIWCDLSSDSHRLPHSDEYHRVAQMVSSSRGIYGKSYPVSSGEHEFPTDAN